jgi:hypothetical protein
MCSALAEVAGFRCPPQHAYHSPNGARDSLRFDQRAPLQDHVERTAGSLVCDAGPRDISEVSRRLSRLRREGVQCHQRRGCR